MIKRCIKYLYFLLPDILQHRIQRIYFKLFHNNENKRLQYMRSIDTTEGYSFKPFDDLRCIFIHIPKCAGVSINKSLFGNLAGGHTIINDYRYIYKPKEFNTYFKFTIVRNPWDRLVSAFHYLKKGGFNEIDAAWAEKNLSEYEDFDTFVKNWINSRNIWEWHPFRPQYHYICINGKNLLDFTGYFENLEEDFEIICKKTGIHNSLGTYNQSSRTDYKNYYNESTRQIVAAVYDRDIELLGYTFDNRNLKEILQRRKI